MNDGSQGHESGAHLVPTVDASQAPSEREQLAAKITDMQRDPSLSRVRGHSAEQSMNMVASSDPQSDAISIVPIATPAKGVNSEDDVKYMGTCTQVLHSALFTDSRRPKMEALDSP